MALKSNELRIGNLISHETWGDHVTMEVKQIDSYRAYLEVDTGYLADFDLQKANGIKLTDEWLKNFRFEKITDSRFENSINPYWAKNAVCLLFNETDTRNIYLPSIGFTYNGKYFVGHKQNWIEYVHQLQNFYFALTGTELVVGAEAEKV